MQNPAQGIHRDLLPHVHCVSTSRYPTQQRVHAQQFADWLREAPDVVQTKASFFWTYLDRCNDGYIFLEWQPLDSLGTSAASDGYIWPPHEQVYQIEVNDGYILEVYTHKAGSAPNEPMAMHARHRYRLLPSRNPAVNSHVDPSLFIVHYSAAEPNDRLPTNMMMSDPRTPQMLSQRSYLQSCGAIMKKEFMLRDASHWPTISWPSNPGMVRGQSYTRTPQTMAYPTQLSGPPAKRARTLPNANSSASNAMAVIEDDVEDTMQGDLFDSMTPRDVSLMRYKQNHKWMECVVGLQYSVNDIEPVDLGLGLKGSMNKLTDGIFHAPSGVESDEGHLYDYVGKLDEGKAEEFRKRVEERIAADNAEMIKMKAKHAKRMAKLEKSSGVAAAEKALRKAVQDPTDVGSEFWRFEGRTEPEGDENVKQTQPTGPTAKVDDIVAQVEALVGRRLTSVQQLRRVQDGGYEPPVVVQPPPPQRQDSELSGVMVSHADANMSNTTLPQHNAYPTAYPGAVPQPTPYGQGQSYGQHQQPVQSYGQQPMQSYGAQPQQPTQSYHGSMPTQASSNYQSTQSNTIDTVQGVQGVQGMQPSPQTYVPPTNPQTYAPPSNSQPYIPLQNETSGEWVVVPRNDGNPTLQRQPSQSHYNPPPPPTAPSYSTPAAPTYPPAQPRPALPPQAPVEAPDPKAPYVLQDEFLNLDSPDTIGMAGYGGTGGGTGGDLDMGMDIDDSAFGDAFHGVDVSGNDGDDASAGL